MLIDRGHFLPPKRSINVFEIHWPKPRQWARVIAICYANTYGWPPPVHTRANCGRSRASHCIIVNGNKASEHHRRFTLSRSDRAFAKSSNSIARRAARCFAPGRIDRSHLAQQKSAFPASRTSRTSALTAREIWSAEVTRWPSCRPVRARARLYPSPRGGNCQSTRGSAARCISPPVGSRLITGEHRRAYVRDVRPDNKHDNEYTGWRLARAS